MRHITVILISVVLFVGWRRQGEADAAPRPDQLMSPPRIEWKLPSGLRLSRESVDISFDRQLGVVWGERVLGKASQKSCWLIDLQTGKIEDLLIKSDEKAARIFRDIENARFAPQRKAPSNHRK